MAPINKNFNSPAEGYDLVCIGFGVSGLSIAIALQERSPSAKVLFLEREKEPSWQPGLAIPGTHMRSSLLLDLVTARNPRSKFTFVNYLHSTGQLMTFTNLGSLRAPRDQFADYLSWCATAFEDRVRGGFTVTSVKPHTNSKGVVESWNVIGLDSFDSTQEEISIPARKVIVAAGLQSSIPPALANPDILPSVFHSSTYAEIASQLQQGSIFDKNIAIIGGNQHAAEIFENLQSLPGNHRAVLYIQDQFLYPDTDHAFTGDILHSLTGRYSHLPLELRRKTVLQKGKDEPPTVDLALLEHLYELQIEQSHLDPSAQRFRIEPLREVVGAARVDGRVQLKLQDSKTGAPVPSKQLFDVVITATGYEHTAYTRLLAPAAHLFDDRELTVGRDYAVNWRRGTVRSDAGVWVLGALASEDDNDDTVFRILALRTEMVVDSVLRPSKRELARAELEDMQPRL